MDRPAIRAWRAVDAAVAAGSADYERRRILPRLLPVIAAEIDTDNPALTRDIVRRLTYAIRCERSRGKAGHWTYDLNRHIGLMQAHRHEARRLLTERRRACFETAADAASPA